MKFELSIGVVETFPILVFPRSLKRIPPTSLSFGHLIHTVEALNSQGVRHWKVKRKRNISKNVILHYEIAHDATSLVFASILRTRTKIVLPSF